MARNESGTERQILWNKYSDLDGNFWNFLIINESGQIESIKQKLYERLRPIIEERQISSGRVQNSLLSYELFSLQTYRSPYLDFSGIYRGKVRFDRMLQRRKNSEGWRGLIEKVYRGEIS